MAIINLFDQFEKSKLYNESVILENVALNKERIFLSHKSIDKEKVKIIAKFLNKNGYDIYLDEYDKFLQEAVTNSNHNKVVEAIKEGIEKSTHLLSYISKNTDKSWWVPYEIGLADEKLKKIMSLKDKEVDNSRLPEFIKIKPIIREVIQLEKYFPKKYSSNGLFLFSESNDNSNYRTNLYEILE